MQIYDVSVPISPATPTYPGDPEIEVGSFLALAHGDAANVSLLHFGAHTGTHVDAPNHFIDGTRRVHELPLDALVGPASVVEIPEDAMSIEIEHINRVKEIFATTGEFPKRLLFKTRNSAFWASSPAEFRRDYTFIRPAAAQLLVDLAVRLVGIDYLSVEEFGVSRFETHTILLSKEVVIVEGLDLSGVPAGDYELICLPLKIAGGTGDGAPARAILRTIQ